MSHEAWPAGMEVKGFRVSVSSLWSFTSELVHELSGNPTVSNVLLRDGLNLLCTENMCTYAIQNVGIEYTTDVNLKNWRKITVSGCWFCFYSLPEQIFFIREGATCQKKNS